MISECYVDAATGKLRLFFKPHEQFQNFPGFTATVEQVTKADEMSSSTCPAERSVDDGRFLQQRHQSVVGSVYVCERNYSRGVLPTIFAEFDFR